MIFMVDINLQDKFRIGEYDRRPRFASSERYVT
jgi:hypothetical protein